MESETVEGREASCRLARQKDIVNKAQRISTGESLQLLKMLIANGVNYTENMNGCFIDLSTVTERTLLKGQLFLDMCIKVHEENDQRSEQIKQYAQECEQHYVPVRPEQLNRNPRHKEMDEINDSNLSSLEKSIMKENLRFSMAEEVAPDRGRKSVTPKFVGLKAKLLKNVRSKVGPAGGSRSSAAPALGAGVAGKKETAEDEDDLDAYLDADGDEPCLSLDAGDGVDAEEGEQEGDEA